MAPPYSMDLRERVYKAWQETRATAFLAAAAPTGGPSAERRGRWHLVAELGQRGIRGGRDERFQAFLSCSSTKNGGHHRSPAPLCAQPPRHARAGSHAVQSLADAHRGRGAPSDGLTATAVFDGPIEP